MDRIDLLLDQTHYLTAVALLQGIDVRRHFIEALACQLGRQVEVVPSVSYAVLEFPPSSVNPPHTHPRYAELLLVAQRALQVGFVNTTNKFFTQNVQAGDLFIFLKGLVHFQHNADTKIPALAISAFGSANAGTISLPNTLFKALLPRPDVG
ncbi:germin-like protein 9-3 [Gastrolobium bilobum]|uniref:germin-like protein 9-3 n=1 Tax=Gastrolobium bilobum TaxID=150636 RepID=UPI002AB1663F|nr:germin-like protein 9-3 [Gastrolobium bilobum]